MRTLSMRIIVCLIAAGALAACSGFDIPTKKVEYKSAGEAAAARSAAGSDAAERRRALRRAGRRHPRRARRFPPISASATADRKPRGAARCFRPSTVAHRARRHPALARGERRSRAAVAGREGFLAGDRLHRQRRDAGSRRHGDRLGRKPREDSRRLHPQHARQAARFGLLDFRARQVPHAPRARLAAGHDRDLHQPSRHGRGLHVGSRRTTRSGSRGRPIRSSKPRCCAG